jgi:hypothetical protein
MSANTSDNSRLSPELTRDGSTLDDAHHALASRDSAHPAIGTDLKALAGTAKAGPADTDMGPGEADTEPSEKTNQNNQLHAFLGGYMVPRPQLVGLVYPFIDRQTSTNLQQTSRWLRWVTPTVVGIGSDNFPAAGDASSKWVVRAISAFKDKDLDHARMVLDIDHRKCHSHVLKYVDSTQEAAAEASVTSTEAASAIAAERPESVKWVCADEGGLDSLDVTIRNRLAFEIGGLEVALLKKLHPPLNDTEITYRAGFDSVCLRELLSRTAGLLCEYPHGSARSITIKPDPERPNPFVYTRSTERFRKSGQTGKPTASSHFVPVTLDLTGHAHMFSRPGDLALRVAYVSDMTTAWPGIGVPPLTVLCPSDAAGCDREALDRMEQMILARQDEFRRGRSYAGHPQMPVTFVRDGSAESAAESASAGTLTISDDAGAVAPEGGSGVGGSDTEMSNAA